MISRKILQSISLKVADHFGLSYRPDRLSDLKRGLLLTARDFSIGETTGEIERWIQGLSWTREELDILSSHLTVGETYFFREKPWLDVFKDQLIPEIIKKRKGGHPFIRIWSAGCCTGEEPYSLAILLREAIPDIGKWDITLLATDINRNFLAKAQKGTYHAWSFRETSQAMKNRYFSSRDSAWEIDREIKKMVTFAPLNLAADPYPQKVNNTLDMDIIFCRNVLMYFVPDQIRMVVNRFHQSLVENGWLITGAVEMNDDYFREFSSEKFGPCTAYHKTSGKLQRPSIADLTSKKKYPPALQQVVPEKEIKPIRQKIKLPAKPILPDNPGPSTEATIEDLFNKGQYKQCALLCESLVGGPPDLKILETLVRSKANLGLLDEALGLAGKLILHAQVNEECYYLYANILLEKLEITKAEQSVKKALFLNPHHLLSHFLMGNISMQLDKKQVALKHFRNVLELLGQYKEDEIIPGSDGLTAGRIRDIVTSLTTT
ncbi:MAG: hypothetical protein M0P58_03875 [Bacteroidales bacterium]|nr:hypothetical protein [Bacteroidales bacterium]